MHYALFLSLSISLSLIPFWQSNQRVSKPLSAIFYVQHMSTQLLLNDHQEQPKTTVKKRLINKNKHLIQCIHTNCSIVNLPAFQRKRVQYIRRFYKTAQEERKKFGVPAAITLAQGILESQQGSSILTRKYKNHFGIKCSTKEPSCNCAIYADDKPNDRFKIYKSDWNSFRDHSLFLQKRRYKKLYKIPIHDYVSWAKGLKAAGYATDPGYAKKLINIIETLELYRFDQELS